MDYQRQLDIVNQSLVSSKDVSIIGCGALGSAVAMALAKMGVNGFTLFDDDGVNVVNLPNQMYRIEDVGKFKVEALSEIIRAYNNDANVVEFNQRYFDQKLTEIVIVTTDSMNSRSLIWGKFQDQLQTRILIEARMGSEEGQIYTISKEFYHAPECLKPIAKDRWVVSSSDQRFYQDRLYSDATASQAKCTEKAIIYNVFMIASLVCRAFKAAVHKETFPREVIFGMKQIHKYSFQIRD